MSAATRAIYSYLDTLCPVVVRVRCPICCASGTTWAGNEPSTCATCAGNGSILAEVVPPVPANPRDAQLQSIIDSQGSEA